MTSSTMARLECAAHKDSTKGDVEDGHACHGAEQDTNVRRIFRRRQGIEQNMQRQKHQPEANREPAEIANACSRAVLERYDPNYEQNRGDRGYIEAKDLNDQGRANVCTEHDCQRWNKADQAVRNKTP